MNSNLRFNGHLVCAAQIEDAVACVAQRYQEVAGFIKWYPRFDALLERIESLRHKVSEEMQTALLRSQAIIVQKCEVVEDAVGVFHKSDKELYAEKNTTDYHRRAAISHLVLWKNFSTEEDPSKRKEEYFDALWINQLEFTHTAILDFSNTYVKLEQEISQLEAQEQPTEKSETTSSRQSENQ